MSSSLEESVMSYLNSGTTSVIKVNFLLGYSILRARQMECFGILEVKNSVIVAISAIKRAVRRISDNNTNVLNLSSRARLASRCNTEFRDLLQGGYQFDFESVFGFSRELVCNDGVSFEVLADIHTLRQTEIRVKNNLKRRLFSVVIEINWFTVAMQQRFNDGLNNSQVEAEKLFVLFTIDPSRVESVSL